MCKQKHCLVVGRLKQVTELPKVGGEKQVVFFLKFTLPGIIINAAWKVIRVTIVPKIVQDQRERRHYSRSFTLILGLQKVAKFEASNCENPECEKRNTFPGLWSCHISMHSECWSRHSWESYVLILQILNRYIFVRGRLTWFLAGVSLPNDAKLYHSPNYVY